MTPTRLIAHRGASADAPENTLAAIRLAWERGAEAVEIDIRLTADRHVAVIHDATTARIGGPRRAIADQRWGDLQKLDAGGWKGDAWRGEGIPSLAQVLATIPAGRTLYIELKGGLDWSEPWPEALIAAARLSSVIFIAFDADLIAAVKERFPDRPALWIVERRPHPINRRPRPTLALLAAQAAALDLDGLDLGGALGDLDAAAVQRIHQSGLRVCVWTINDPAEARRLLAAGVDGIASDRADWLKDRLYSTNHNATE